MGSGGARLGSRSKAKKKVIPPGTQLRLRWGKPVPVPKGESVGHGGKRKGAGRKAARRRDGRRVQASHRARPELKARHPVHVTLRVAAGIPSLRCGRLSGVVLDVLEASQKEGRLSIVHFSVQGTHVHLICEVDGKGGLTEGMRGLGVRLAKAVNRVLGRKGRVVEGAYHAVALTSPNQVRNALAYVLRNGEKHGCVVVNRPGAAVKVDPLSSAAWFDGWLERDWIVVGRGLARASVARAAGTWLLREGWRRAGALSLVAGARRGRGAASEALGGA